MAATREDAMLVVELSKLGAMMKLDEASRSVFADDFDPDAVEASDPSVQSLLMFYETIGTLVKNGLLDRDLIYDWLWAAGVWAKVGPAAGWFRLARRLREVADGWAGGEGVQRELRTALRAARGSPREAEHGLRRGRRGTRGDGDPDHRRRLRAGVCRRPRERACGRGLRRRALRARRAARPLPLPDLLSSAL